MGGTHPVNPDPRSTDALAWTLTVRARPSDDLPISKLQEWNYFAKHTIVIVTSPNGVLMQETAYDLDLLRMRDDAAE